MAKLLVPSGTTFQESCGEVLSPTQLGLPAVLLATFFGIIVPSLKVVEVRVNGSAAHAAPPPHKASASAPVASRVVPTSLGTMDSSRVSRLRNGRPASGH